MDALEASINAALGGKVEIKTNLDFQPFMKTSERSNSYPVSDWASSSKGRGGRPTQSGVAGGFAFKNDEEAFADKSQKTARSFLRPGAQRTQPGYRANAKKLGAAAGSTAPTTAPQRRFPQGNNQQGNNRGPQQQYRGRQNREIIRSYSCAIPSSWEPIDRYPLTTPQGTVCPTIKTLATVGVVEAFNPKLSYVSPKQPKPLVISEALNVAEVSIENDPYIQAILKDEDNLGAEATFVMTSSVASLLMCAHHTIQPWDLKVTVTANNNIIFVTTGFNPNNIINQHLVDETSIDKLPQDADSMNSLSSLAQEATQAQYIARHMMVARGLEPIQMPEVCPQVVTDGTAAITSYIYRTFTVDDMTVIVRAPLLAHTQGKANEHVYIGTCFEFDGSYGGYHVDYRKNIDNLYASVFSNEIKTNAAHMHRMACEAMLMGADEVRLAWVSRTNATANTKHTLVHSNSHSFQQFISMLQARRVDYYEGIATHLCALLVEAGDYTLLREPNERSISLFKEHPADESEEQL